MVSDVETIITELGTHVPTKAAWLEGQIRQMNADRSHAEKWREEQLLDFIEVLRISAHDLKRAYEEKKIATIAWIARNLLELSVWIEYCEKSDVNAKQFDDDATRDAYGWAEAINKLYKEKSGKDNASLRATIDNLSTFAQAKGIPALDDDYKRVSDAATEIGLGKRFVNFNKLYSKFAHPTAWLVHTVRAIERDADMREMFLTDGTALITRNLQIIYERVAKWRSPVV